MKTRFVSEYLLEQLASWGVKRIYGVTGDAILPWMDAMGKQTQIEFVQCRHESAAAMMASAEAKLTGRPAVCTATSGPGTLNLLNGLADAHMDRVPVVAITGQVETQKLGGDYKQYVQQEPLLSAISHYSTLVAHPEAIGPVLQKAFMIAATRKGVTHLAISKDVFGKWVSSPVVNVLPEVHHQVRAQRIELEQAAEVIERAKKPLFLAGTGARSATRHLAQLADQLGAGLLLTLGAKGAISDSHPAVLGGLGEGGSKAGLQALWDADLLVIFGASWFPRSHIPAELPLIQIDENPEAFHHDPKLVPVTANVEEAVTFLQKRLEQKKPDKNWRSKLMQLHQQFWQETENLIRQSEEEQVKPETLLARLGQITPPEAIVALDTGEHTLWFNRAFRAMRQVPLFSGKWRTMGYALPAAIAAQLNEPEKEVVAIVGDGGLLMNVGELMTIKERGLPIKIVVVNNGTLGLEEVKMKQSGYEPFGTQLENPDFVQLATAFGITALRARTVGELMEKLNELFELPGAALLEVVCTAPTLTRLKQDFIFQNQA
ncbi:thiamine pyrophosphate-binding protein [Brevibacillus fulvus]|uniref:Pyruvate dehydrogenase (Quinone)/pyruvate oxidase n=1 Tax=Brevibacillus fulvus TaxID=1125967 RepID=A0A938XQY7_9BACL|nr:thiamine pyrophosphate-binding protein [Brevibacillus fulvus]MBM7588533.1 pyruvate dehydrogenase (quinone)/pyruvate oxidase [Brevibacillus fulvus]